jgi:hypothetical protein
VESFYRLPLVFCCCKKATAGSSFCGVQKQLKTRKLETESWMRRIKKPENIIEKQ